jgi:putative ABC transport system permease protein
MRKIRWPFVSQKRDDEMTAEMHFHIDSTTRDLMAGGMSRKEAEFQARRRFGSVLKQKEAGHEIKAGRILEDILRDVRLMTRGLLRTPGFTVAVVLTLALGIGANTAIFSIVDQLLLRPLPYPGGENLVMLYESMSSNSHNSVSPANWLDWQRDNRTLERVAAWAAGRSATLTGAGDATRLSVQAVSWEFFPVLGVAPILGRTIEDDDDQPNAPDVAVISHRLWQTRFGADRNVVGRFIQLNDTPTQVVGVMPPQFRFVYHDSDVWMPLKLDRNAPWRERGGRIINVVARVKAGTDLATAGADMDQVARRLASIYAFNKDRTARIVPLREELTGQVEDSLIVLYIAVGVLLAIACFNIANLLIARAASRRQEIAVRTSLGAARGAIVRQLLVESMLLALVGGTLGIVLARSSLDAIVAFAPPQLLGVPEVTIDARVLLYVAGLSVLTGLVAGLAPSVIVARRSIVESLHAGTSRVMHSPRIRQLLVVGQVAMTVVLLCGAALLVRTVNALDSVNHGFEQQGLLTMQVALPATRYPIERQVAFQQELLTTIRQLPGVDSAGAASGLPVIGAPRAGTSFHRLSTPVVPRTQRPSATIRVVTPGYFHTLRIPVLRGREFTHADDANPTPGFIVNQAFVDRYLPSMDPLRESLMVNMRDENPYAPIIGVVGNVGEGSMRGAPRPTIFYSHSQLPLGPTLLVRTDRPAATAEAVTSMIRRMDPNLVIRDVRLFEEAVAESLAQERLTALVSVAFAVSGLLLASLGLYALLAFLVAERTREIGLRIALGAQRAQLMWSVVANGLRLAAIGAAAGVAVSLVVLPSLGTLLFGVKPNDGLTYTVVLSLLAAVAGLASYVPARRAARVQPLTALRQE